MVFCSELSLITKYLKGTIMLKFFKSFFQRSSTEPTPVAPYKVEPPKADAVNAQPIVEAAPVAQAAPTKKAPAKKRTFVKREEGGTAKVANIKAPAKSKAPTKPKAKK